MKAHAQSPEPSQKKPSLESLDQLRWQHRIILVSQPESCDEDISNLRSSVAEVLDRDILWFAFCAGGVATNFSGTLGEGFTQRVQQKYFDGDQPIAVLIGKDGGVKNQASSLDLIALNQQIDTMPMRQREMREKASQ